MQRRYVTIATRQPWSLLCCSCFRVGWKSVGWGDSLDGHLGQWDRLMHPTLCTNWLHISLAVLCEWPNSHRSAANPETTSVPLTTCPHCVTCAVTVCFSCVPGAWNGRSVGEQVWRTSPTTTWGPQARLPSWAPPLVTPTTTRPTPTSPKPSQ